MFSRTVLSGFNSLRCWSKYASFRRVPHDHHLARRCYLAQDQLEECALPQPLAPMTPIRSPRSIVVDKPRMITLSP